MGLSSAASDLRAEKRAASVLKSLIANEISCPEDIIFLLFEGLFILTHTIIITARKSSELSIAA